MLLTGAALKAQIGAQLQAMDNMAAKLAEDGQIVAAGIMSGGRMAIAVLHNRLIDLESPPGPPPESAAPPGEATPPEPAEPAP